MSADKTAEAKRKLRKKAGEKRKALHGELAAVAPGLIAAIGLDFLQLGKPGIVSGFHPYGTEIDCTALLHKLGGEGWTTCLPVVMGPAQPLSFRVWTRDQPLEPGAWDILTPQVDAETVKPDVMLVPLLAFDKSGYRLGYGGGFYDRTIELARSKREVVAVGVAFAGQKVKKVPHGKHDQPLDWMLTEAGAFKC